MKVKIAALALLLALVGGVVAVPLSASVAATPASAQTTNPFAGIPITGTLPGGGTFSGTFTITHFANVGGRLVAQGTLSGTVKNAAGDVIKTLTNVPVTLPLQVQQPAACPILHLDIGPITLNLLGLVITTNRIVLDITAVPGAGNLLGNLLCSVAHLLDNTNASTSAIAALLNSALRVFQGL